MQHQKALTILDVAKLRKRSGLGVLSVCTVHADSKGVRTVLKRSRNKASKARREPRAFDNDDVDARTDRRQQMQMAVALSISDDVKSSCKLLWTRLRPIFSALAHAHIDGSVHPTYKELSKFQDIATYLRTRMKKTKGSRPSAWNVFILRTVVMQDLLLETDECSYAMVAAAAWEGGFCDKDAWRASRNVKTMFLCADRVPPGCNADEDIGAQDGAPAAPPPRPEDDAGLDALTLSVDERTACTDVWTRLQGVFRTLAHAHIDGSVHPTYKELQTFQVIYAFITARMRKTDRPSTWSAFILRMVVIQDAGVLAAHCSPAMVVAAVWEAGFCDRDAWRSAKNVKTMFVYAEFYGDESKYSHAWPSPWLDTSVVPLRFKHRLAAAAAMICNATDNHNLVYVCSGMDFLLPRTYMYYKELKEAFCKGTDGTFVPISVQQWCSDTGFFDGGRLQRALALDRDDNFQLQDVGFVKQPDAGAGQYLWLPVVAYYVADMEARAASASSASALSSLSLTPLLDVLRSATDWTALSLRVACC